jgi:chromosome segregation protein
VFLKSLTIKGFKSFADAAELALEPGITVVVGPNGSGKSNVVDAMAWVLGAQAPSAVRSQKMEDVIFAGTAARKALGRAEVSLTIDNTDGVLPVDFTEVTVTRTLFRTGESEYAINGVSCRLLDVQELLSDSGVGRQQHIIVSQGRIDDVLNARPEDRRSIIEEAAGVLKFRKRRERAERRLASTGEDLQRLQDVAREVRRQIKPLEKQAEAARRHAIVVSELSELKTHLAGRELTALTGNLEKGRRQQIELADRDASLTQQLARFDAQVLTAETELSALGASDVADILSRARSLGERIRGQLNVVGERRTRLEGELQNAVDDGLVANLEAEAARITAELAVAGADLDALRPEFTDLQVSEQELTTEQLSFDSQWGDSLALSPSRAAELRGRIDALSTSSERDEQELNRLTSRLDALERRATGASEAEDQARGSMAELQRRLPELEQAVAEAAAALERSEVTLAERTEAQRAADAEASRWQARAEALSQALDEARVKAGAEALESAPGVLGTLLDLVDIDEGYEAAVEAAVGDALSAVVVDSHGNAHGALAALDERELSGAVLALGLEASSGAWGTALSAQPPNLAGLTPIRAHVRALRSDVDTLLDALLAGAVVLPGYWQESVDTLVAHPDTVFVTRAGDRFSRRGWRLRQGGTGATGAALEEAQANEESSARTALEAAELVAEAREAFGNLQQQRADLDTELQSCRNQIERATMTAERSAEEIENLRGEREQLTEQRATVFTRKQKEADELRLLLAELPAIESEEEQQRTRVEELKASRDSLEERVREMTSRRTELEVKIAALEERRESLKVRQTETESRLVRLVDERDRARVRRERLEHALRSVQTLADRLETTRATVAGWVDVLDTEQRAQSEAAREVSNVLSKLRGERSAAEKELGEVRERTGRLELAETEYRVKLEALVDAVRRELDTDPESAMAVPCPELPDGSSPEARVRELERELKIMGAINPLALEEYEELKERAEFLQGQLDDVKSARRDLHKLIRSIDDEIVGVFRAAYADVSSNFEQLFQTLFPGGKGAVKLTNAEDILNCGIEIEAKPSGKNVKKLSLLSGGERSLVALAFLFAVFRSRPSPFYVMDEVEAALDDMNLSRFLALVEEFRGEAQLIIVSHQKRTMEAADVLYGVSMKPGGSSKVVTEKTDGRTVGAKTTIDLRERIEADLDAAEEQAS